MAAGGENLSPCLTVQKRRRPERSSNAHSRRMGRTVQELDEGAPGLIRSGNLHPLAPVRLAPANPSYRQVLVAGIVEVAW